MAFCNSCGATLSSDMKFCNKCGAPISGPTVAVTSTTTPAPAAPPAKGGSSALKIVLIVIAAIVLLGILGVATVGFIGYRIAKSSHVSQHGDKVKVDTPLGTFSANDPEQVEKELGVDIYPGAEIQKEGSSSATFAGVHTVTGIFQSGDPADKVCSFYKPKFPDAMVSSSDPNRCTIVSNKNKNMVTINVEGSGDGSKLQITTVTKPGSSSE